MFEILFNILSSLQPWVFDGEQTLDDDNEECLEEGVGGVRSVERGPQVESGTEEAQKGGDTDLQEDGKTGQTLEHTDLKEHLGPGTQDLRCLLPDHSTKHGDAEDDVEDGQLGVEDIEESLGQTMPIHLDEGEEDSKAE